VKAGYSRSVLIVAVALSCAAQTPTTGVAEGSLCITHGPVVEDVTETTAVIAWSTNVNAGTQLHYGFDPGHLDHAAGMPWGGLTHRVELSNLRPGTQYFFCAESPHGQGSGDNVRGPILSFRTRSGEGNHH